MPQVDETEAQYNHALLCELLVAQSPPVMANVPKVVSVFAEVLVAAGGGGSDEVIDMADERTMWVPVRACDALVPFANALVPRAQGADGGAAQGTE